MSFFSEYFKAPVPTPPKEPLRWEPSVMFQGAKLNLEAGQGELRREGLIEEKRLLGSLVEELKSGGNLRILARSFSYSIINWRGSSIPTDASGLAMQDLIARGIIVEPPSFSDDFQNDSEFSVPPYVTPDNKENPKFATIVCPSKDKDKRVYVTFKVDLNLESAEKNLAEIEKKISPPIQIPNL